MQYNKYNTNLLNLFLNGIAAFNTTITYIMDYYPMYEIVAIHRTLFNYENFANNVIGIHFVVSTKSNDKIEFDISLHCVIFGKPTIKLDKQFEFLRQMILKGLYGEEVFTMKLFDENDYDIIIKMLYYAFINTSNKIVAKDIVAFNEDIDGFNRYLNDVKSMYDNYDINAVSVIVFNTLSEKLNKIISTSLSDKGVIKNNDIKEATTNYINIIVSIFGDILTQSALYNNNLDIKNVFVNGIFIIRKLLDKLYNANKDVINKKRLQGKEIKKKSIRFWYIIDGETTNEISIGFGELYTTTVKNDYIKQYQLKAQNILQLISTIYNPKNNLIEEHAIKVMQNVDERCMITTAEQTYMCNIMMNIMYNIYFINEGKANGDINNIIDLNQCMFKQYINWFTLNRITTYLDINKQLFFLYRCFFDCIKYIHYNTYSAYITSDAFISIVLTLLEIYTYKNYGVNAFVNIIYIISVIFQYYIPISQIDDEQITNAVLNVKFNNDKAIFTIQTDIYEDIVFDIVKEEILMYPEQLNDIEHTNKQQIGIKTERATKSSIEFTKK